MARERKVSEGPMVTAGEHGVTVRSLPGWEGWVFRLMPRLTDGGTEVGGVEVVAPDGQAITPDRFRRVPVGTLLRFVTDPWPHVTAVAANLAPNPHALTTYSQEHLDAVAIIYRFAVSQGVPPRRTIAEHFDIADKTVDRWLRRARERGLLGTWADERHAELRRAR
jgi:Helix-turn-helix domain